MEILAQRWRLGRAFYRPAREVIDPRAYEVAPIPDDATAKQFVLEHHYAGSYPAARYRFGLYRGAALVGVAVFSQPCSNRVITNVFPGEARLGVELGRFVLLDAVEANGETWFLAQCFRGLKAAGLRGVVSFSDPVARTSAAGHRVFPGHLGTIYQAHNGAYLGRSTARTLRLLPDGLVFSDRAAQKVRAGDRGWRYAAGQLERHGAPPCPEDPIKRRAWARTWTAALTRALRHPGNHRYAWPLTRSDRLTGGRYPKQTDDLCIASRC